MKVEKIQLDKDNRMLRVGPHQKIEIDEDNKMYRIVENEDV